MTNILGFGQELQDAEHRLLVELRHFLRSLRKTWASELTFGQRISDKVAATMGWEFSMRQTRLWKVANL